MNKDNYKKNKLFVLQKKWQHKWRRTFNQIRTAKIKKKKKRRMRILSTVFFLSFLAGKFATFE